MAEITNLGESESEATTIEWLADDERLGESMVPPLAPGSGVSVGWTYRADSIGATLASGQLMSNDAIRGDNHESVVFECIEKIPVLIARQEADYGEQLSDTQFFTAALGFRDDGSPHEDWQSVFVPEVIGTEALATAALNDYHVVVITNLPKLPAAVIDRLADYVQDGGGLWIAMGSRTDRAAFNSTIFNDGAGFCPLPLLSLVDAGERDDSNNRKVANPSVITIHPPSEEHPATVNLADTERLDIEEVQISRYFRFAEKQPDQDVAVLLETSFGEPLAIESYFRQGRVIIQAVPLGVDWTNWPLTKSYVVMVHDWLTHLAQSGATKNNLRPGGHIIVDRNANSALVDAEVRTPQGNVVPLVAHDHDGSWRYRFTHTRLPGVYHVALQQDSEPVTLVPFHVARDVEESDLSPLTPEARTILAATGVLSFQTDVDTQVTTSLDVPNYRPIWPLLLTALLALMALEVLLASRFSRQRFAPVTMTS